MKKIVKTVTTTVTEEIFTNEKTHIVALLDRSGSMSSLVNECVPAFNNFLKTQRELPDEATISIVLFDDQYDLLVDFANVKNVKVISKEQWSPRGMTALNDGLGKIISDTKAKFTKLGSEKPSKVLVCVVTDGEENASKEYKTDDIKRLVKECEGDNWSFIYLGANVDSFSNSEKLGFSYKNTSNYTADHTGVAYAFATASNSATKYRSMSVSDANFKDESMNLVDGTITTDNIGTITTNGDTSVTTNADGTVTFKNIIK